MQATEANVAAIRAVVSSMSGMPHFPFEPDARGALLAAFIEFPTLEEAEQAAAQFRRYSDTCPTECDINRAAAEAKRKRAALHAETCPKCAGTGFVSREVRTIVMVNEQCACPYGERVCQHTRRGAISADRLRAEGVKCSECQESGWVVRPLEVFLDAAERCDCAMAKGAAA